MDNLQKLLNFLEQLEQHKLHFTLSQHRNETITVHVDVPGERWEIEFFADGEVEVEIFRATNAGVIGGDEGQAALQRLLKEFGEP